MKSAFFAILFFCTGAYALAQSVMLPGPGLGVTPPSGNSLIFTAASSQYLSATGKTNINQQKFSFSTCFKSINNSSNQTLLYMGNGTVLSSVYIRVQNGPIVIVGNVSSSTVLNLVTTGTSYNDGNWHSLVAAVDTTQATNTNRAILYVDNSAATYSAATYPTQNTNLANNFVDTYYIGNDVSSTYFNGKLAQTYYIDGQALTPSSFITGSPCTPKTYSGTYTGHFDFFLPFSNGTSTTTLGADSSGENNNWTLNNMTTANQSTDYP